MSKIEGLLGPECGYIDLLDNEIIEKKQKEQEKPPQYNPLRPSASGFCARKLAYDYHEYKGHARYPDEQVNPDLQRLFDLGHSVEYSLIKQFERTELLKVKYKQQAMTFTKISEEEIIEGSNDLCIYIPGHRVIADVKSKGTKFSSYNDSSWGDIDNKLQKMKSVKVLNSRVYWVDNLDAFLAELDDQFFADNFYQLNLYATSEFMVERGIDHAAIIQYEKNKSRLREIRFRPSLIAKDYVIDKFHAVANAVNEHKNPELVQKEYTLGSMKCAFCRHKNLCWPDASKKDFFQGWPEREWPKDTNRLGAVGTELEMYYKDYVEADIASNSLDRTSEQLCHLLERAKVQKVRFSDGNVFELKFLKSPRPHFELRRGKV